ncbi:hypothetical protein [Mycobacterium deserti]|uniref:Serine/threonine protein kinase n=1 Tax=Mycobacterium deserti TaxID=2978347 RepID=A0ABT2MEV5_9MYCO|nr:hypothetical protein [Mycobacterium deserti]MCT7660772.1 hypothetical protein [Mycobacterium deserti]
MIATAVAAATLLAAPAGAQPGSIDDRGFVDTAARCDTSAAAVAFGRTEYALIAICRETGRYEYRGVRLNDDALLSVTAVETANGVFTAENDAVTYTFSAKELAVAENGELVRADPMVAYVEPRLTDED